MYIYIYIFIYLSHVMSHVVVIIKLYGKYSTVQNCMCYFHRIMIFYIRGKELTDRV